jgi:hypothetical protein
MSEIAAVWRRDADDPIETAAQSNSVRRAGAGVSSFTVGSYLAQAGPSVVS